MCSLNLMSIIDVAVVYCSSIYNLNGEVSVNVVNKKEMLESIYVNMFMS